jgi:shikimate dehydrogenase
MHSAAFLAAGVNSVYVAFRCSPEDVPGLIRAIARAGGGGNITIPYKQAALNGIDVASAAVRATGACNTFWLEEDRVHGDNTDVEGFAAAAGALVGTLEGRSVFLLGAGGAARAAVFALLQAGAESITVASRNDERSRQLASHLDPEQRRVRTGEPGSYRGASFDLVVNATPLGLHESDEMPFKLPALANAGAVLDLVYRPGGTPLVHQAAALGIPARDGFDMLLAQGAAAFERWFRQPAPVDVMREALMQAM